MTEPPEERLSPKRRSIKIAIWSVVCLTVALLMAVSWFFSYTMRPGPRSAESTVVIFIPKGASSRDIAGLLAEQRLIHNDVRFLVLVRLMGQAANLQAGEFRLKTNQLPLAVIRELSHARPVEHSITIPEGLTITQIAAIFSAQGWVDESRFVSLANDPAFIAQLGLHKINSLEGYLFPETYRLIRPSKGERAILKMLVDQALSVWSQLEVKNSSGLTRHQVFTLASIIEKESGVSTERPLIASVFFNRLKKKMKLQSDPTVIYGLEDYNGNLTRADLKTQTPYNTYVIPGLPAGPIANPGSQSLQAVLTPAESDYLYFVSKNDGTHYFSTSLRQHNRAVQKYQRNNK